MRKDFVCQDDFAAKDGGVIGADGRRLYDDFRLAVVPIIN